MSGYDTIAQEIKGLQALVTHFNSTAFNNAVKLLMGKDLIICTGIGKSGNVARKVAATMTSIGTPAVFVHPVDAVHGDLGLMGPHCGVLAFSRSGNASELSGLYSSAIRLRCPLVLITENIRSVLALRSHQVILLPKIAEAWGHAPTTSTIMQMALGDALAVEMAERKGFTENEFKLSHPGGDLGKEA